MGVGFEERHTRFMLCFVEPVGVFPPGTLHNFAYKGSSGWAGVKALPACKNLHRPRFQGLEIRERNDMVSERHLCMGKTGDESKEISPPSI